MRGLEIKIDRDVVEYCYLNEATDKWIKECRELSKAYKEERAKMINDNEGMDNALDYYRNNGGYWGDWTDEDFDDNEDFCDWDEYDDYDVEWDEGDYDDD